MRQFRGIKDHTHARRSVLVRQKLPTRPEEKIQQPIPGTSGGSIQPPHELLNEDAFLPESMQQEADSVISPQLAAVSYMTENRGTLPYYLRFAQLTELCRCRCERK
jgi:hypothetical protein